MAINFIRHFNATGNSQEIPWNEVARQVDEGDLKKLTFKGHITLTTDIFSLTQDEHRWFLEFEDADGHVHKSEALGLPKTTGFESELDIQVEYQSPFCCQVWEFS